MTALPLALPVESSNRVGVGRTVGALASECVTIVLVMRFAL